MERSAEYVCVLGLQPRQTHARLRTAALFWVHQSACSSKAHARTKSQDKGSMKVRLGIGLDDVLDIRLEM